MRAAGLDIGTNSVRLLIADIDEDDNSTHLHALHRLMNITRLGQGVDERGSLDGEAIGRTLTVLTQYRDLLRREKTETWQAAATSAVRDAANGDEFLMRVREIMGAEPRVLSGEEEAGLSFLGATYDLGELRPREGSILVVDIGGGSTEIVVGESEGILYETSLDVGCVRMSERFLHSDPPLAREREEMEAYLRSVLAPLAQRLSPGRAELMVGLAGTVTTLSGLKQGLQEYNGEAIHHTWLSVEDVQELYRRLYAYTLDERRDYMRLEPGRADVIVGGTGVLLVLLRELERNRFLVSEKDILDALAITASRAAGG